MANKNFRCDKFVDFLQANANISSIVPGGIRFGDIARDDTQDNTEISTYLTARVVSDDWDGVTKGARVELRLIASRLTVPAVLLDIFDTINAEIIKKCGWMVNMSWFVTLDIDEGSMFWPSYDVLDRLIMYKDYIIYYLIDQ